MEIKFILQHIGWCNSHQ